MKLFNKRITLQVLQDKSGVPMHRLRRLFYPDNNVKLHKPELRKIADAFGKYGIVVTAEELAADWNTSPNPYLRYYARRKAIRESLRIVSRFRQKVDLLLQQNSGDRCHQACTGGFLCQL